MKDDYKDILNSIKSDKKNFLNNNEYTDTYYELANKWRMLPIYTNKKTTKTFFDLLKSKQVILITSGTGSGKTVIIPKFILKYIIDNNIPGKIAITNPKQLTTKSNAVYAAKTLDVTLGEEVGYKYKNSSTDSYSNNTRLLYLTDGTLLSIMVNLDKILSEYYAIIIDEAHERQIQIDILMLLIKEILHKRPDFKLIIMSATINSEVFKNYFNIDGINYGELDIYDSTNYEIKHNWNDTNINIYNYLQSSIKICNKLLPLSEDILVFVPTQKDTIEGCKLITDKNKKLYCAEVYSKMTDNNKELAISKDMYKSKGKYDMKVIFSTNVAESSITFDGLKHVIDTGLELVSEFDSKYNMNVVKKDFTTQAQIKQRIGRVGRTAPGTAHHLYTEKLYNELTKYPKPSILTTDLIGHTLSMIKYYKTINDFMVANNNMITPPTEDQIQNSLHKLKFIQCIKDLEDTSNGILSAIGVNILKFRSDNVLLILGIIMSYYMNCQPEFIIISAMLEVIDGKIESLFTTTDKKKLSKFKTSSYKNSDHLTLLNIYSLYKEKRYQYLNIATFLKIENQIRLFTKYANNIKPKRYDYIHEKYNLINIKLFENNDLNILYVLYKSHLYNIATNKGETINFINNSKANINFSPITSEKKNNSGMYIFNNLVHLFGKKVFRCVTLIPDLFITK